MADLGTFDAARREARGERDYFTLCGEKFVVQQPGSLPILEFSAAAAADLDSNDPAGLAAMFSLLHDCIADGDWTRFRRTCHKNRVDGDTLMSVVRVVMEGASGRPTSEPSASSDGRSATGEGSKRRRPLSAAQLDERRRRKAKSLGMTSVDELMAADSG